jgi:hypothetical protein
MLTAMGGEVRGDQLMLLSGIDREGEFVVCHAYYIEDTYAKPQYYDEDFVPQRAYKFNGVYRDTVVPVLEPSSTFVHMLFTLRVYLRFPGYLRFIRVVHDEDGNQVSGHSCSEEARQGAVGGGLSATVAEETYCLCGGISYGEMVACEDPTCKIEWFHYPCVGLASGTTPPDKWYCPVCAQQHRPVKRAKKNRA